MFFVRFNKMSQKDALIQTARSALKFAYAPYSKYRVGAALLSASGKIFTGCNVENTSYGLTVCAERVAIFKAVSAGERKFKAIAITALAPLSAGQSKKVRPCGACLQVMKEFADDLTLYLVSGKKIEIKKLSDLLPEAFVL